MLFNPISFTILCHITENNSHVSSNSFKNAFINVVTLSFLYLYPLFHLLHNDIYDGNFL